MKKFILWFANCVWWPRWSNIRWRKERKLVYDVKEEHKVKSVADIKRLVKILMVNYNWTKDGIDQLGDSICPPAYNYKRWCEGVLKDDCDGFHALVYHCLQASNVESYLLSVTHLKGGHCVLLFKYNNLWYVDDYGTIHCGSLTATEAIDEFNKIYERAYENNKNKVAYNSLVKFDYKKKKFKTVSIKKLK